MESPPWIAIGWWLSHDRSPQQYQTAHRHQREVSGKDGMIRAARDVIDRCVEVLEAIYGSAPPIACEACGHVPADLRLPRLVCMSCHHQAMQEAAVGHVCEDCGAKATYADPRLESRPLCWPCWSDGLDNLRTTRRAYVDASDVPIP